MKAELEELTQLNLPIGWDYYPFCRRLAPTDATAEAGPAGAEIYSDSLCNRERDSLVGYIAWALKALITGLLIGLGAPFWYDVARRLSEVRRAFGGRGAADQRHRGADAAETAEGAAGRDALIERIVASLPIPDAAQERPAAEADGGAPAKA